MSGIIISINPVIIHLGPFELRWYSLAIVTAIIAAVVISARRARTRGIAAEQIYSLALWAVIAGVIGARLFHIFDHWNYYMANPGLIIQLQQGGLAIWGALAGGFIAAVVYARTEHLPFWRLADTVTPGLLVAQIIGRFGCIVNGDAAGGLTTLPWAFIYTHPNALVPAGLFGVPTHPYPVYEQIWNAATLIVIWQLSPRFKKDGTMFMTYMISYSMARFLLTFVRQETAVVWGLQEAQVVAVLGFIAAIAALVYLAKKRTMTEKPAEA